MFLHAVGSTTTHARLSPTHKLPRTVSGRTVELYIDRSIRQVRFPFCKASLSETPVFFEAARSHGSQEMELSTIGKVHRVRQLKLFDLKQGSHISA